MFKPKTVFVLGAGASCDFNLPTGDALRADLIQMLARDGDNARFRNANFNRVITGLGQARPDASWTNVFEEYAAAARRISDGLSLATSIDNYLDAHQADPIMIEVGKLAITTVILEKEAGSPLAVKADLPPRGNVKLALTNTQELAKSWYLPLMRLLVAEKTVHDVATIFDNVAFIVFNYDRCLEHFLVNALINYYNVAPHVAVDAVNALTIIHPYGQVGRLPWQDNPIHEEVANFGGFKGNLLNISRGIRTFTESMMSGTTTSVKDLMADAETLVFMGFGFLPQNIELLTVGRDSAANSVFLTTMGIGDNDVEIVIAEMRRMIRRRLNDEHWTDRPGMFRAFIERGTCRNLMDGNWLRLTH